MSLKQMCNLHFDIKCRTDTVKQPYVKLSSEPLGVEEQVLELSTTEHCVFDMASIKGRIHGFKPGQSFATGVSDHTVCLDNVIHEPEALAVKKRLTQKQPRPTAYDDDYDAPDPEAQQYTEQFNLQIG